MVASSASMTCCWNLQHRRYTRCVDAKNENLTKTSLNVVRTCVDMFGPCDWDRIVIHFYADCQPERLEVPFRFCHSLTSMIYMPRKFTRTGWTSKSIQDVRNGRGPAHGDKSLGPFLHNQLPSTSTSLRAIRVIRVSTIAQLRSLSRSDRMLPLGDVHWHLASIIPTWKGRPSPPGCASFNVWGHYWLSPSPSCPL
jgi:hypothetical protein